MKKIGIRIGVILVVCVCVYMIYAGAIGRSSAPKQASFTYHIGDEISEDPATYLKGSTVPWNVKLDFSSVDTKKAGTYDVIVSQPGYTYSFQIIIE